MGYDMCIAWLWIETSKEPDWEAGHDAIAIWTASSYPRHMTPEGWIEEYGDGGDIDLDEDGDLTDEGLREVRRMAHQYLEEVKRCVEQGSRQVAYMNLGPYGVWITGGPSGGDDPTEMYRTFAAAGETPALEMAGFYPVWDPDKTINEKILDSYFGRA